MQNLQTEINNIEIPNPNTGNIIIMTITIIRINNNSVNIISSIIMMSMSNSNTYNLHWY